MNVDHRTLDEVRAAVGIEDEYFPDIKVDCYKLDKLERDRLVLVLGVLPVAVLDDGDRLRFAMIQFDEHDRAIRLKIAIRPGVYDSYWPDDDDASDPQTSPILMRKTAEKWVNAK